MKQKVRIGQYGNKKTMPTHEKLQATMGHPNFHGAYMRAAQKLLSTAPKPTGEDAIPIFFLQRHALELLIKDCLLTICATMKIMRELDPHQPQPSEEEMKRATGCHNLWELFRDLEKNLFIGDDSKSPQIKRLKKFTKAMYDIDPTSMGSRFNNKPDDKNGPYRKPVDMDLQHQQKELEELSHLLLGTHSDYQNALMTGYDGIHESCLAKLLGNGCI